MRSRRSATARRALLALLFAPTGCARSGPALPSPPPIAIDGTAPVVREQLRQSEAEWKAGPRNAWANGRLGMLMQTYGRFDQAIVWYRRAATLSPDSMIWRYLLGVAQASRGDHDAASRNLSLAVQMDPDYVAARVRLTDSLLSLGRAEAARQAAAEAAARFPGVAPCRLALARSLSRTGDWDGAIREANEACRIYPGYGAAHYLLAVAYRRKGQSGKAEREERLNRAHEKNRPALEDSHMSRVMALAVSGESLHDRAISLEESGRLPEAAAAYADAVQADPAAPAIHAGFATLLGRMGRTAEAAEHFSRALALSPRLPNCHYNFGILRLREGRKAEARAEFERELEVNDRHPEAHQELGSLLEADGRLAEAEAQFRKAIAASPGYRLGHYRLGTLLLRIGNPRAGIAALRQAVRQEDPDRPFFTLALAEACARLGKRDEAIRWARDALDESVRDRHADYERKARSLLDRISGSRLAGRAPPAPR